LSFVTGEKGGGLRRLLFLIGLSGKSRRERDRKTVIARMISALNVMIDELKNSSLRLMKRHKMLIQQAIVAYLKKERDRSAIYANEAAQVKNMVLRILTAEKVLEQVKLRLETMESVSNIPVLMSEAASLITAAKEYVKDIVPGMAYNMEKLVGEARSAVVETTDAVRVDSSAAIEVTPEARKLLEKIRKSVEESVKEQLPEIPLELLAGDRGSGLEVTIMNRALKARQASSRVQAVPVPKPKPRPKPRRLLSKDAIDKAVLEHIIMHGGFIDVNDVARELGVTKKEIMESLHRLREQNRIRF